MSCRYKNECPSYSGWCEGPKQDFSKCVQFLIPAYENIKRQLDECGDVREKQIPKKVVRKIQIKVISMWSRFFTVLWRLYKRHRLKRG